MVGTLVHLEEKEDKFIKMYMVVNGIKNKNEAIREIIRNASKKFKIPKGVY